MYLSQVNTAVLVGNRELPLYIFLPDDRRQVTCMSLCAASWPPVYARGQKIAAGGGAKASLLRSDRDPTGGRVVTYNGWPLYTYRDDTQPGKAEGQGVDLDGGYWYLLRPNGTPVVPNGLPAPNTTSPTTTNANNT